MRVRACMVDRYRRVNRRKLHLPAVLPPLLSVLWPSLLPSPPDRSSVFTPAEMDQNSELFGKTTRFYSLNLTLSPFHLPLVVFNLTFIPKLS